MFSLLEKVFILSSVLHCGLVAGDDMKDENIDKVGLWFGPRLGKRTVGPNSIDNRQAIFKLLDAAEAVKYYYDQVPYYETSEDEPEREKKKSSKVVFTPILGRSLAEFDKRSDTMDFTPRLGRRLSDDMPATPPDQELYQPDPDQLGAHAKYFSPRLGRTMTYSPRLGRQLNYAMYPNRLRLTRSANKTTQT